MRDERPYGRGPQYYYSPPAQGEVMVSTWEQGRIMRQTACQGYRPQFYRSSPHQRQPKEDSDEEDTENQGAETPDQQLPQCGTTVTSITHADTQKSINHNTAVRQSSWSTSWVGWGWVMFITSGQYKLAEAWISAYHKTFSEWQLSGGGGGSLAMVLT